MVNDLLHDTELRARLRTACVEHERVVRDVMLGLFAGDLDSALSLRACALELQSLKGLTGVLGLPQVGATIGSLPDTMAAAELAVNDSFWESFNLYFASLVSYVKTLAEGITDEHSRLLLVSQRSALVERLSGKRSLRPEAERPTLLPLSPSSGRRLLVIDDSATARAVLSARLSDRGYPVRAAKGLRETAQLLIEFDPEIVICDVQMPEVDGDEVCVRLKAHMKRIVPVVLYSSIGEQELSERARRAGADGFVCKQNGIDALVSCLDQILSEEVLF